MNDPHRALVELLKADTRYKFDAYLFVREGLSYAQDVLNVEGKTPAEDDIDLESRSAGPERHLTGQQLCEAIREYAIDQYGLMAKVVLNNWGVRSTSDFGEIVYNMIEIGLMKKSDSDQRKDFDKVYDFSTAFQQQFEITMPDA